MGTSWAACGQKRHLVGVRNAILVHKLLEGAAKLYRGLVDLAGIVRLNLPRRMGILSLPSYPPWVDSLARPRTFTSVVGILSRHSQVCFLPSVSMAAVVRSVGSEWLLWSHPPSVVLGMFRRRYSVGPFRSQEWIAIYSLSSIRSIVSPL